MAFSVLFLQALRKCLQMGDRLAVGSVGPWSGGHQKTGTSQGEWRKRRVLESLHAQKQFRARGLRDQVCQCGRDFSSARSP